MPSLPSKKKNLVTTQESLTGSVIKTFHKSPILLDFVNWSQHIL